MKERFTNRMTLENTDGREAHEGGTIMKYCVIGGQYEMYYYGSTKTLLAAKRLATKNTEYWDNWQGYHRPQIYRFEDTEEVETVGMITYRDGCTIRSPKMGAEPVCYYDNNRKCWMENQND